MSRCFPYPPPGYTRDGMRDDALIESIKLQREAERVKKERKKDRKRERKEKHKEKHHGEEEGKKRHHKRKHREYGKDVDQGGVDDQKKKKSKEEEKSSITEEHGDPSNSQNSFDSAFADIKKPAPSSLSDEHINGNGFRIRLSVPKPESEELQMSPPTRSDESKAELPGRLNDPQLCSSSGRQNEASCSPVTSANVISHSTRESGKCCKLCPESVYRQYRALVVDWVPPAVEMTLPEEDSTAWLFETNRNKKTSTSSCKAASADASEPSRSLFPKARYLTDADIYALPYTLPF